MWNISFIFFLLTLGSSYCKLYLSEKRSAVQDNNVDVSNDVKEEANSTNESRSISQHSKRQTVAWLVPIQDQIYYQSPPKTQYPRPFALSEAPHQLTHYPDQAGAYSADPMLHNRLPIQEIAPLLQNRIPIPNFSTDNIPPRIQVPPHQQFSQIQEIQPITNFQQLQQISRIHQIPRIQPTQLPIAALPTRATPIQTIDPQNDIMPNYNNLYYIPVMTKQLNANGWVPMPANDYSRTSNFYQSPRPFAYQFGDFMQPSETVSKYKIDKDRKKYRGKDPHVLPRVEINDDGLYTLNYGPSKGVGTNDVYTVVKPVDRGKYNSLESQEHIRARPIRVEEPNIKDPNKYTSTTVEVIKSEGYELPPEVAVGLSANFDQLVKPTDSKPTKPTLATPAKEEYVYLIKPVQKQKVKPPPKTFKVKAYEVTNSNANPQYFKTKQPLRFESADITQALDNIKFGSEEFFEGKLGKLPRYRAPIVAAEDHSYYRPQPQGQHNQHVNVNQVDNQRHEGQPQLGYLVYQPQPQSLPYSKPPSVNPSYYAGIPTQYQRNPAQYPANSPQYQTVYIAEVPNNYIAPKYTIPHHQVPEQRIRYSEPVPPQYSTPYNEEQLNTINDYSEHQVQYPTTYNNFEPSVPAKFNDPIPESRYQKSNELNTLMGEEKHEDQNQSMTQSRKTKYTLKKPRNQNLKKEHFYIHVAEDKDSNGGSKILSNDRKIEHENDT